MTIGIYQIKNKINGKVYIGQSINIEKRLKRHLNDLRKLKHRNQHLLYKQKNKTCKQKFRWGYVYTINGKRKHITSVDLYQLKKKVLSKNLEWFITDKKN